MPYFCPASWTLLTFYFISARRYGCLVRGFSWPDQPSAQVDQQKGLSPLLNPKMAAVETTDTEISSDEAELQEAREAVKVHNRKKKKSGGFQSMG